MPSYMISNQWKWLIFVLLWKRSFPLILTCWRQLCLPFFVTKFSQQNRYSWCSPIEVSFRKISRRKTRSLYDNFSSRRAVNGKTITQLFMLRRREQEWINRVMFSFSRHFRCISKGKFDTAGDIATLSSIWLNKTSSDKVNISNYK